MPNTLAEHSCHTCRRLLCLLTEVINPDTIWLNASRLLNAFNCFFGVEAGLKNEHETSSGGKNFRLNCWAYGKHGNPESGIRNGNRIRNRNGTNKWMLQVGKCDSHQYSSSLFYIHRKMDDDMRSPFKKRYEYKEQSFLNNRAHESRLFNIICRS